MGELLQTLVQNPPSFAKDNLLLIESWYLQWLACHRLVPSSSEGEFREGCEEAQSILTRGLLGQGKAHERGDGMYPPDAWQAACFECVTAAYANSQGGACRTACALAFFKAVGAKLNSVKWTTAEQTKNVALRFSTKFDPCVEA